MTTDAQEVSASSSRPLGLTGAWLVAIVGGSIALTIMGDSLMYSILPLAALSLGIPLPLVGILLSANRFVRLLSNAPASRIFERFGPRLPFIGSVAIGVTATILYGVPAGFTLFLVARLLWGIAWSGLRQGGYQSVWTGAKNRKGRLTGLLWGLVRLGSAIGVLVGGILYDRSGYQAAILFVSVMAVLAIPISLLIRWAGVEKTHHESGPDEVKAKEQKQEGWRAAWADPLQRSLVVAGFFQYLMSGVIVSTTAVFLAIQLGADSAVAWLGIGIATLTGLLQSVRWIADLALGPLVGALSDKVGQAATAATVAIVYVVALVGALLLPPAPAILCLVVVLLADGAMNVVTSAAASGVALKTSRPHLFVGVFTTTTDAGSAFGPLVAYSLVASVGLSWVYGVLGFLMLATVLHYWRLNRAADYGASEAR